VQAVRREVRGSHNAEQNIGSQVSEVRFGRCEARILHVLQSEVEFGLIERLERLRRVFVGQLRVVRSLRLRAGR